jgi:hypothetical protein
MAQIIHGANIGYVKKKTEPEPVPQPVVENPVKVVENQPITDVAVEKGGNEGGSGEGEIVDHSVEGGWKTKRDKRKVLQDKAMQDKPAE